MLLVLRLVLLLTALSYAAYSLLVAYDLPFADHWRFLRESLVPYLQGDVTLLHYLLSEYRPLSHKHVVTLLHLLLNYRVFDLDYRIECYVGLVSTLAMFGVLAANFLKTTRESLTTRNRWLILVTLAFALLNPMNIVAWSLVQFEYLYLLLVVVLFSAFDSSKHAKGWNLPLWIATAAAYATCDAANFTAVLALGALMALFGGRAQRRQLGGLILTFAAVVWLMDLAIGASGVPPKSSNRVTFALSGASPVAALDFFLYAYAQPILDHAYFRQAFGASWIWAFRALGVASFGLSTASLGLYYRHRERLRLSSVPALLVLFGAVSALGIFLSRFWEFGAEVALSDRYMRLFDLGLVGGLWIVLVSLAADKDGHSPARWWRRRPAVAWTLIVACVSSGFLLSSLGRWMYLDHIMDKKVHLLHGMYRYAEDPEFPIEDLHPSCGHGLCRDPIDFLQREELSFFRKDFARQHWMTVGSRGERRRNAPPAGQ